MGQSNRAVPAAPGLRRELTPHQWRIARQVVRGLTGYEVGAVGPLRVETVELLISRSLAGEPLDGLEDTPPVPAGRPLAAVIPWDCYRSRAAAGQ
jgi:hypothetical protein